MNENKVRVYKRYSKVVETASYLEDPYPWALAQCGLLTW